MIDSKRVLAVVPARGGSKGVRLKNITPLAGRPLIAWVADAVAGVPEIDRTVVSTDHAEIRRAALDCGLEVPFLRPAALAGDMVPDQPVLEHALQEVERGGEDRYDIIVMLQPTSPLRTSGLVRDTIRALCEGPWDSVWTVSPTDPKGHPLKQLRVGPDDALDYYAPAAADVIARQQLSPVYHKNGGAYAITRDCLVEQKSIKGVRCRALVVGEPMLSIDTRQDVELTEFYLARRDRVDPD